MNVPMTKPAKSGAFVRTSDDDALSGVMAVLSQTVFSIKMSVIFLRRSKFSKFGVQVTTKGCNKIFW